MNTGPPSLSLSGHTYCCRWVDWIGEGGGGGVSLVGGLGGGL